jgi:hypothetical protein
MSEKVNDVKNDKKLSSNLNDIDKKFDLNDVEKMSPDELCVVWKVLEKKKMEIGMDLADDTGENVEGWGTWAKPGSRSELQGEDGQAEIGRSKRLNKATEPRRNPSTMPPNDLPPCIFKEDLAKMKGDDSAAYFEATTESLGLGEGEEFILIKVSKGKRKCWATFLSDDTIRNCRMSTCFRSGLRSKRC